MVCSCHLRYLFLHLCKPACRVSACHDTRFTACRHTQHMCLACCMHSEHIGPSVCTPRLNGELSENNS